MFLEIFLNKQPRTAQTSLEITALVSGIAGTSAQKIGKKNIS